MVGRFTYSRSGNIRGTIDDPLYVTGRNGSSLSYAFAPPNGTYTVTLKFAETIYSCVGQRRFNVDLEGVRVLSRFDIVAEAGGSYRALDRTFSATVSDGVLNIVFSNVTGYSIVSAIEIVPATPAPTSVTYIYRADGLRASKTVSGTAPINYTWDLNAGLPVIIQDSNYSYVYGLGGLISQTDAAGNQTYFLANGLGSTEKLTDGLGNVIAGYKYDVFGAMRSTSGTGWSEYRFTGQEDDAALGFTYFRARYYDPATGRFLTKDPVIGVSLIPRSLHSYGYAWNDPVNLTDPSGEFVPILLALAAAAATPEGAVVLAVGATATAIVVDNYVRNHQKEIVDGVAGALSTCIESVRVGQQILQRELGDATQFPAKHEKLSSGEIKKLKNGGYNPELVKQDIVGKRNSGKFDLFKDNDGNVVVKPKDGRGPGEPTGININEIPW